MLQLLSCNTVLVTSILRKANGQRPLIDFFLKQVLLVKEEDDGSISEPLVVANRIKEIEAFLHAVLQTVRHVNASAGPALTGSS